MFGRHRFAFGLRTLVLLLSGIGISLGLACHRTRCQHRAVSHLQARSNYVYFDYQLRYGDDYRSFRPKPNQELAAPDWLVRLIGPSYFRSVIAVDVISQLSHEDCSHLSTLSSLRMINILNQKDLDDSTFATLSRMKNLDFLGFNGCSIDGRDFSQLAPPRITCLEIIDTPICDDALKHLARLDSLRCVTLRGTEVSDQGVAHLKDAQNIEFINLCDTNVTDAGLMHLTNLNRLSDIYAMNTKITEEGVRRFEEANPKCKVRRLRELRR